MNSIASLIAFVGLSLSSLVLLVSLSWAMRQSQQRAPTLWLVSLSLLVALQALEFIYHDTGLYKKWPFFIKVADPFVVLIPLTLYGYIRSLQGDQSVFRGRFFLLHLSPSLLVLVLGLGFWQLPASERIFWLQQGMQDETCWQPLAPFGNAYLAIIAMLSAFYWLRQSHLGYAGRNLALRLWLRELQQVQLLVGMSLGARIFLSEVFGIYLSMAYALTPIFGYLLYLLLSHARPPQATAAPVSPTPSSTLSESQQIDAKLHDASLTLFYGELEKAIQQGLFKDNELSLPKIAAHTGISVHQASAAINQCFGSNYYDWVNQYRIEEAKQLLKESDLAITQICYEMGFNSKSTFNAAFKKLTDTTPSAYRKAKP